MPTNSELRAANDPLRSADVDQRMEEFKRAPDPWMEVARLTHGGDRSFAYTIQSLVWDAAPSQYPALEKKLLEVLKQPDCTDVGREFVCHMLALIGSEACVPALAPWLTDEQRSDMARYALENIPGEAVDRALHAALATAQGRIRDGLASTIAARQRWMGGRS